MVVRPSSNEDGSNSNIPLTESNMSISPIVTFVVLTIFTLIFLLIYHNYNRIFAVDNQSPVDISNVLQQHQVVSQEDDEDDKSKKKLTVKQRKRLELKEEAKRLKALREEERQEKEKLLKKKQELLDAKRAEKERARLEEEEKRRLEEEKVYQELSSTFKVESEGFNEVEHNFDLNEFIQFIIDKKLCNIEELSVRFHIKPKSELTET